MRTPFTVRILGPALALLALTSACADAVEVGSGAATTEVAQASAAQDQKTQSDLRNVLVAAMTAYVDGNSYSGAAALIPGSAPGVCVTAPSTAVGPTAACGTPVSVYAQGSTFAAAAMSESGTCFWIKTDANGTPAYGSGTPCTGMAALAASAPTFSSG
jgi:hypothetical protein